ncbi:MAG: 30S ribosomal protein S10 [Nanoarchaeota archaeon]|nr:30S ribosomal protein S10 [Nanoarchaeota archaeon]
MQRARIKLMSTEKEKLEDICRQIKEIAEKVGVDMRGPIPLPTKRLKVPVRRSPCGSGRETYETWEMRIHKRLIDLGVDERVLRLIMRIPISKDVHVEMEIVE